METRVKIVLDHVKRPTLHTNSTYISLFSIIHTDEKLIYMTIITKIVPPSWQTRTKKNSKLKRFITKITFRSAVERHRYDEYVIYIFEKNRDISFQF